MSTWLDLLDRANIKPKPNLAGTAPPTVDNDDTEDYAIGSRWTDGTNDKDYVCTDPATGAAVWVETTGGGAAGPATDLATSGSDVAIDSTAPPGADYVLKSTSTTVATWQAASTPSGLLATCMAVTSGATVIPETFTALAFVATPEVETDASVIELTSTTTFTLKKTGAYQLIFNGVLERPTTGNVAQFRFRVNGTITITGGQHSAHTTGAELSVVSVSVVYEATADDTLTLEIDGDTSSDYEIHDGANMQVTFFG